jgi:hypothetical protein
MWTSHSSPLPHSAPSAASTSPLAGDFGKHIAQRTALLERERFAVQYNAADGTWCRQPPQANPAATPVSASATYVHVDEEASMLL